VVGAVVNNNFKLAVSPVLSFRRLSVCKKRDSVSLFHLSITDLGFTDLRFISISSLVQQMQFVMSLDDL